MSASARDRVYRVLHLEDSELDHELMVAHLVRGGLMAHTRRVESEIAFLEALDEPWDVVVSDYNLPGFSGLLALELVKANARDIPFVLVSGEIGEETHPDNDQILIFRIGACKRPFQRVWCCRVPHGNQYTASADGEIIPANLFGVLQLKVFLHLPCGSAVAPLIVAL